MEKIERIPERQDVLDDTCYRLYRLMLNPSIIESGGIRYNELHRLITKHVPLSKPSFNTHLQHLINKKYVIRKKDGKQKILLTLNFEHPAVKSSKEAVNNFEEDKERLSQLIDNDDYLEALPILIARTMTINSLNAIAVSVEFSLIPERDWKKKLALECTLLSQTIYAEEQQFIGMLLKVALQKANSEEKVNAIVEAIRKAKEYEKKERNRAAELILQKNPNLAFDA